MKNYFPHDHHARSDKKLINLSRVLGMAGLGLYWCIIEMLYEENGWLKLADLDNIAYDLRTESNTINILISDFDLFFTEGQKFSSRSVLYRLKLIEAKSSKAAKAARTRWQKCKEDANAMQTHSDRNALNEIKEKEIKENEIKENEIKTDANNTLPPFEKEISDSPEKVKKPKEKSSAKKEKVKPHLFRESLFFDLQQFTAAFCASQYAHIDLQYYYNAVLDWSDAKGIVRIDWIAQARTFMRSDREDGKLKIKNKAKENGQANKNEQPGSGPSNAVRLAWAIAS